MILLNNMLLYNSKLDSGQKEKKNISQFGFGKNVVTLLMGVMLFASSIVLGLIG